MGDGRCVKKREKKSGVWYRVPSSPTTFSCDLGMTFDKTSVRIKDRKPKQKKTSRVVTSYDRQERFANRKVPSEALFQCRATRAAAESLRKCLDAKNTTAKAPKKTFSNILSDIKRIASDDLKKSPESELFCAMERLERAKKSAAKARANLEDFFDFATSEGTKKP